jgi:hypothetical protein
MQVSTSANGIPQSLKKSRAGDRQTAHFGRSYFQVDTRGARLLVGGVYDVGMTGQKWAKSWSPASGHSQKGRPLANPSWKKPALIWALLFESKQAPKNPITQDRNIEVIEEPPSSRPYAGT